MAEAPRLRRAEEALEPGLFGGLRRAVKGLGRERLKSTYQTTFWFDLGQPRCLPEAAALALRSRIPPGRRVVGVEWWLSRMRTSDVQVDFHRDRDERLALASGRVVHPRFSSVLFLNRCRGGLLAVTDQPPCEENPALAPSVLDLDLVRPHPNRFVVFDGRLTHGVLDERNRIPGAARRRSGPSEAAPGRADDRHAERATLLSLSKEEPLPVASTPLRLAVIFNWWHRRPLDVPRWDETRIYRSLALPAVRAARRASSPGAR